MKYIANPVEVDAYVIVEIEPRGDGSLNLRFGAVVKFAGGDSFTDDAGRVTAIADKGMTARYIPFVGDYYVVQSDGYAYLNPKEVFERKYSPANK